MELQIVDFETAKLLQKCGFNLKTFTFYQYSPFTDGHILIDESEVEENELY